MDTTAVNSDSYNRLPPLFQAQADAVAHELRTRCGAYKGSSSDALTDAVGIVLAIRFAPMGDNHHNAAVCPYCSPDQLAKGGP